MSLSKGGNTIKTLEDWERWAGPKSKVHWQENRSAMEVARAWLDVTSPSLPPEVEAALLEHPDFKPVKNWAAEPEVKLHFDHFKGEPRNTDLLVDAEDDSGRFLIALEAKADEPFGDTVAVTLAKAIERKLLKPRSNGVARVEQLAAALLGPKKEGEAPLDILRYQLLTATAGALRGGIARKIDRVVMLVQEFITNRTKDKKHIKNAHDFDDFVNRLSHGAIVKVEPGRLYGPISVPGYPPSTAMPALYLGKVTRNLRCP